MTGKPVGTAFAEISLDSTKLEQGLKRTHDLLVSGTVKVEDAYKSLGIKSDQVYDMMRTNATAAVDFIKNKTLSSKEEIVRAETAAAAKIKSLNEQQFGHQATLVERMKSNWVATSVAITAAWMLINRAMAYMDEGARAMQVESSFTIMAESSGVMADSLIANMKRATKATVDDSDLMQKAIKLMTLGYNPEQIERFSKVVITASQIAGTTAAEAYEGLADAIANRMPKALVKMGAVTKEQMKIVNKAIESGADSTALYELAMANLELKQKMLQGTQDTATLAIQRFHVQIKETKEEIGKGLIVAFQKLYATLQVVAAGTLGLTGNMAFLVAMYARYRSIVYEAMGDEKKAASNRKFADDAMQFSKDAWGARNDLMEKATGNMMGMAEVEGRASKQEIDNAKAKVNALMKGLAAYKDNADAAKKLQSKIESLTEKYNELKITMGAEVSTAGLDPFVQEMSKIEAKWDKIKADFTIKGKEAVPGSFKNIELWKQTELEKAAKVEMEKINQELVKDGQEIYKWQEDQRKITELQKKDMLEIYQGAEQRITQQINELDLAEALGASHIENLQKRIDLEGQLIKIRKQALEGINYIDDPDAWRSQYNAMVEAMKKGNELAKEQKEQIGTLQEGWDKGWRDMKDKAMTAFKAGEEMFKSFADNSKNTLSNVLFDGIKGDLKNFSDYWYAFYDALLKKFTDVIAQMVVEWVMGQQMMKAVSTAGSWVSSLIGGGLSAIGGGGGEAAATYAVAKGDAFYGGRTLAFADGGIYDRPTFFPMARGYGLMGEAGPEAVMPLKRTRSGKLGVAMEAGSSTTISIPLTVNGASKKQAAELRSEIEEVVRHRIKDWS